jgi:uncharacterized membrane protein
MPMLTTVSMLNTAETALNSGSALGAHEPDAGPLNATVSDPRGRLTKMLLVLGLLQASILSALAIVQHRNFGSWGFDLGIYDQAWWLVGQDGVSGDSFMTMRGLPVWGHHINAVFLLLAPFAKLGVGVEFLMVLQNFTLALGALPLAWLARSRSGSDRVGIAFGAMYLLYPAVGWLAWVSFHPEALAVTPLLFAAWFAHSRRRIRVALCLVLALSCRQDIGLVIAGLGAAWVWGAVSWRDENGARRFQLHRSDAVVGALSAVAGLGWFVVATKWLIPAALGGEVYYLDRFYARFGSTMGEVAVHLASHPGTVASLAGEPQARTYLFDLFGPLGFAPILGVPLLAAVPQLVGTIVADSPYIRDVRFQYTALLIPGMLLGALHAYLLVGRRSATGGRVLLRWMLLCSVLMAVVRGPVGPAGFANWKLNEPRVSALREAVALVPSDARVAAADNIAPHLTHRRSVYDFPNPFEWMVFGRTEADAAAPTDADWVVVVPDALSPKHRAVYDGLIAPGGGFYVVFDRDGVQVATQLPD